MKATGICRKVDDLGRVVVPAELRRVLGIAEGDSVEIFTEEDRIILRRYEPACCFCASAKDTIVHHGKLVCKECIQKMRKKLP